MPAQGFTLFDTAIGRCGIAWGDDGVVGTQLPEPQPAATRARMLRRFPGSGPEAPPTDVQRVIDDIVALLRGVARDFANARLDLRDVPGFDRAVYMAARAIAPGETITYGELAAHIGDPDAARAVGQALGRNPFPIVIPCHRVLAAGGKTGGFSASGGAVTKLRLLAIEGASPNRSLPLPLE
jgi:methylated-DNA-[protein]-cysteine S-methyltransferase